MSGPDEEVIGGGEAEWSVDWSSIADVDEAAHLLADGGLVAFATETVYGLGADATNPAAVARIFEAKGRPSDHPLIVHLSGVDELDGWVDPEIDAGVRADLDRLGAALWPGPLTVVVPRGPLAIDAVTGGRDTVGLRVPDHPLARRLIREAGTGVAAPSANRFGRVSPTSADDVASELGASVDRILDGGHCMVGLESTIVELVGDTPTILRPGGVPTALIEHVLGRPVHRVPSGPSRASGMLSSHYAPSIDVELVVGSEIADRSRDLRASGRRVGVLEAPDSSEAFAHRLYRNLRDADDGTIDVLLVVPPAPVGLGEAIVDRLSKAAAPRP